jgi:alpha/beta superfamily hydrolase
MLVCSTETRPAVTDQLIRSSSVLPARGEDIVLYSGDGLALVGELALPAHTDPIGTLICVHPLPTHGGMMDSHLLRKMAARLPALADLAILRFNTRGTRSARGQSEGAYEAGDGEGLDLAAAVAFCADRALPKPWLVGWSFGTDVILRHARQMEIAGVILLSPPLRTTTAADLDSWRDVGVPVIALVPERDDYLPPDQAIPAFAGVADIIVGDGARHLWTGEPSVAFVMNAIVEAVAPDRMPLATTWAGPMEQWSGQ